MRVRFAGLIALGAAVVAAVLVYAWSQSSVPETRASLSDRQRAASANRATNGASLTPRADVLRRLEEELSRTLKPFSPQPSLEGAATPTYRPPQRIVISPESAKDEMDRKKNWAIMSPEEVAGLEEAAKLFDTPEFGVGKKSAQTPSKYEALFDNVGKPRSSLSGSSNPYDDTASSSDPMKARSSQEKDEEENLPQSVKDSRSLLSQLRDPKSENNFFSSKPGSDLSDIFKTGEDARSFLSDEDGRQTYRDQFRQSLPMNAPSSLGTLGAGLWASPLANNPTVARPTVSVMDVQVGGSLGAQVKALNPVLSPKGPEDLNARVLNQWNPMYVAPRIEPPKLTPPPKPNFDFPRRKF